MLIRVFPPHYQLVYINFDISSFSLISYTLKWVKLHGDLRQVATRFNRDCQMIGYILFYKLPVIIR